MRPWWETAIPHKDICEGKFDEAVFAADLGNAMLGRGPLDYIDPETFFGKTYMTHGLREFLKAALLRLAGRGGQGVVQLRTPFGGGKTHALVALYHLLEHRERVKSLGPVRALLEEAGLEEIPPGRAAGFVGTYADVVAGRTPWGAIAERLGLYDLVRRHDEEGVAPGKERLLEMLLRAGPMAVLIDEVLEYAVRARKTIGEGQVSAFLHELTEAAGTAPNALVVISLPASPMEIYDEHAEKLFNQIQKVVGRVETIHTPVEGDEIYEVVRRRLFERLDPDAAAATASAYFEYYQQIAPDLPAEAREPAYREKMKKAYPFHPRLIDVLYHRWGSLPTFQRTRGVLRLLALVVGDLYRRQVPAPQIHVSHVNLADPRIRAEFIKHTGSSSEYESVVAADFLAEGGQRLRRIDAEMGSEYEPYRVATAVATAVFLHSFSGAEHRRGATLAELKLSTLRPGLPSTLVEGALQKLGNRLWFLHEERGLHYFSNVPNLNLIITQQEENLREPEIAEAIRSRLETMAGKELPIYPWPERPADIPEAKRPVLVVLSPEHVHSNAKAFLEALFSTVGTAFRVYKNTLSVVVMDEAEYGAVRQAVRHYLAVKRTKETDDIWDKLREDQRKSVEEKLKDALGTFERRILEAYRHLYRAEREGIKHADLGTPTIGTKSIGERVLNWLRDNERLLARISPEVVAGLLLGQAERKAVGEMWEDTLRFPGLPLLESQDVLYQAVREGVKRKLFGLRTGECVYFGEPSCPVDLHSEVLKRELAESLAEPSAPPSPEEVRPPTPGITEPPSVPGPERPEPGLPPVAEPPKRYYLRAEVPVERWSEIMRGVMIPLKQAGCTLKVVLELTAVHEKGIGKEVLELKVRETLRQTGTKILAEE